MFVLTDYCGEVWDVFGETESKRLQKLQNRAARIILDASNDVNHTIALRTLGWEPLSMERKKAKAKMMFKILNNMGARSLTDLFSYKSEKTEYHLRDISKSLCLSKPRTDYMKKSFMYDGIIFLKTSGKVNHFLPFTKKLLLTLTE